MRGFWSSLDGIGKILLLAVLALVLFAGFTWLKPKWDIWWAGINAAQSKNEKAISELGKAKKAGEQAREDTADVLEDYARTQKALAETAKKISELDKKAKTAEALARGKDRRIEELEMRITTLTTKRLAEPEIKSLWEARDALAAIDSVYRSGAPSRSGPGMR